MTDLADLDKLDKVGRPDKASGLTASVHDEIVGLVPAAGGGTRLYPFSKAVPKEMYPILGKAAIEHCIENLKEGGIRKIFVVVGHQKGALMDYIGDGSHFGVTAAYIYQYERKGLGHAILQAKDWINKPFTVLLGDSFIEPKKDIRELLELHRRETPLATLLLFEVEDPEGYGIAKFKEMKNRHGEIETLVEKPSASRAESLRTGGRLLAITGVYVFDPRIFGYIEKTEPGAKGEIQITDAINIAVQSGEKVMGLVLSGRYLDIGKWKTVLAIEKELAGKMDVESQAEEREQLMKRMNQKQD
ncbi:MAG: NTP transferase domain-containing protein [Candidatus Aenigmarchaeota archaeon]|nr:NTP transferase domain-containing protein [Candidatus Aenigmarchaeota archaeon]